MPCLVGCLALFFPRLAIILVWLFGGGWLEAAFPHWIWPVLGFFFLPLTVLAYALAWHLSPQGSIDGIGIVIIVIAVLIDLGIIGGSASTRKTRYRVVRQ